VKKFLDANLSVNAPSDSARIAFLQISEQILAAAGCDPKVEIKKSLSVLQI
jgi:hypothetical protein